MSRGSLPIQLICALALASAAQGEAPELQRDVLPVLKVHCVRCHGPAKQEGGLNLSLPTAIARGGESGSPFDQDDWQAGLLWKRIAAGEMPPEDPLPAEVKDVLRAWLEGGADGLPRDVPPQADGDEHWAYQPLRDVAPPEVSDTKRVRTELDRFVQAKLEAVGLSIGPEADRAELVRRVAFDLTGLPPTPEEVAAFINDPRADAYEAMVERYLASPHYGERWGKYWLDAAGYADSNGYFNADTDRPLAYRYRDWVIQAIGRDQPFDQFLREQLAGDELAGYHAGVDVTEGMLPLLTATHFLRNSPDGTDSSDGNDDERRADKYAVLEGTVQIMGSALFGLTTQCGRCHDHKFEPFKQRDYYQLQAVLYPAFNVENWTYPRDRHLPAAPSAVVREFEAKSKVVEETIAAEQTALDAWVRDHRPRGKELFIDRFDGPSLAAHWSNSVPGDGAPAGQPGVNLDSTTAPGAMIADGRLRIVESGADGDRAFSTQQVFDWTPNSPSDWVQVTFDLVEAGDQAPYVAYFLALRDFNDRTADAGGNVLIDGAQQGQASVHIDYPGADARNAGKIGVSGYRAGHNYGVRITRRDEGAFELSQVVDGVVEENTVTLNSVDLPDGGFGFEYCCGRSFTVDNVMIEASNDSPEGKQAEAAFAAELAARRKVLDDRAQAWRGELGEPPGELAFVTDLSAEAPPTPLLERGDYKSRKETVSAAAPSMVSEPSNPAQLDGRATPHSTGRRLAFANWMTRPNSRAAALLARVTVNRWWAHHFGAGIVATPENLGYSGATPSHPELLDFLAGEFMRGGWSAKSIHRLILRSAAYRQTTQADAERTRLDPDGKLLSRYPLRRLDAEALRDGMLAAAGTLDRSDGGPYVPTERADDGDIVVAPGAAGAHRRSIYLQQRRTQVLGMLDVFDAPSLVTNCTSRVPTTIPLQSLKLLNSDFARDCALELARRVAREAGDHQDARLTRAFLLALGRAPTDGERQAAIKFLAEQPAAYADQADADELAWADYCQALLASNAFLYLQ